MDCILANTGISLAEAAALCRSRDLWRQLVTESPEVGSNSTEHRDISVTEKMCLNIKPTCIKK